MDIPIQKLSKFTENLLWDSVKRLEVPISNSWEFPHLSIILPNLESEFTKCQFEQVKFALALSNSSEYWPEHFFHSSEDTYYFLSINLNFWIKSVNSIFNATTNFNLTRFGKQCHLHNF